MSDTPEFDHAKSVATAKRLLREAVPARWKLLVLSLICMVGAAGFTGALAYSTRLIVNDIFVADDASAAVGVAMLVIAVSFGKSFFQYANSVIGVLFDRSVGADYQKKMFEHILKQDVSHFSGEYAVNHMAKIKIFGTACGKTVVNVCNKLSTDTLTLIALFGVMVLQDPLMTLFCSIMIPIIFLLVSSLSKRVRAAATAETELTGMFYGLGTETFEGIKTVKSFQLEEKSNTRFRDAVDKLQERLFHIAKITSATVPIMELLGGIVIGLFVIYASWQTITFGKTPGEFTAFITAFLMAYQPAERVSKTWVDLQKKIVHVGSMYEILDAEPVQHSSGNKSLDDVSPSLQLEDVSFRYDENVPALDGIALDIRAGERIAIIGRSGAGKSTLIDLMQRFYDPTEGMVTMGGVDLREVETESLRRAIALISQDVFLFDGTLRENILDGHPSASEEDVRRAASLAQLDELIERLPGGLDAGIGPNGRSLSGGQRQRVGIARGDSKTGQALHLRRSHERARRAQ